MSGTRFNTKTELRDFWNYRHESDHRALKSCVAFGNGARARSAKALRRRILSDETFETLLTDKAPPVDFHSPWGGFLGRLADPANLDIFRGHAASTIRPARISRPRGNERAIPQPWRKSES